jgi:hypothetical protein
MVNLWLYNSLGLATGRRQRGEEDHDDRVRSGAGHRLTVDGTSRGYSPVDVPFIGPEGRGGQTVTGVTAVTAVFSVIMGLVLGWCITLVVTSASVAHSQERMQRKVRYWQAETARARAEADHLAREVAAREGLPSAPGDWPQVW